MTSAQLEVISSRVLNYLDAKEQVDNFPGTPPVDVLGEDRCILSELLTVLLGREYELGNEFDELDVNKNYELFKADVEKILLTLFP